MEWRVRPAKPVAEFVGAAVFAVAAVVFVGDPVRATVAVATALALAAFGIRDVLAPVRLAAGAEGLTVVRGYLGRRHIAWSEIERIRVDRRTRLFGRSTLLEIDTGSTLHFLSAYDLGAEPDDVADELRTLRTGH